MNMLDAPLGMDASVRKLRQMLRRLTKESRGRRKRTPARLSVALSDFRPIVMGRTYAQADVLDYTAWLLATAQSNQRPGDSRAVAERLFGVYRERVQRYGVSPEFIARRQLTTFPERCTPDAADNPPEFPALFSASATRFEPPRLEARMQHFGELTLQCFERLYEHDLSPPDELIHVSCSGYLSPSPAQRYLSKRAWHETNVTHSYHMGCYGAFPPVRMAAGYLAAAHCAVPRETTRVDIVHTELLSMHADFSSTDPGSIVNMTLFADGFVRYSVSPTALLRAEGKSGLAIAAADTRIIGDSSDEMTWIPHGDVFEMYLSKAVPGAIRDHVVPFARELCAQAGFSFEAERSKMCFAIHPGGPKILDHVRDALGIQESQLAWCRSILRDHGNMSSATIPHIWQAILEDRAVPHGTRVLSMAFGPGLTACGMILEKVSEGRGV